MPKQNITFLGLTFKRYRTITTSQKKEAVQLSCQILRNKRKHTIRYIARIIGLTSSLPGDKYGGFHYKYLEKR